MSVLEGGREEGTIHVGGGGRQEAYFEEKSDERFIWTLRVRAGVLRLVWLIGPSISQHQLLACDKFRKARGIDVVWWVNNRFLSVPGDAFGFGEDFAHQLFVRARFEVDSAVADVAVDFAV